MKGQEPKIDLGPALDFLRHLWALDHALQQHSKSMEKSLGITGPQRLVLRLASRFPGLPAGEIARLLHLHPSTITGVIQRLERRGLVGRRSGGPDRRRSLLHITPAGMALLGRPDPTIESVVDGALRKASPTDVKAAIRVVAEVGAGFEQIRKQTKGEVK